MYIHRKTVSRLEVLEWCKILRIEEEEEEEEAGMACSLAFAVLGFLSRFLKLIDRYPFFSTSIIDVKWRGREERIIHNFHSC